MAYLIGRRVSLATTMQGEVAASILLSLGLPAETPVRHAA